MEEQRTKQLLWIGLTGSVVIAICCFTPILLILLGLLGLGAVTGYLDYVLLPALAFFIGLTAYAAHRHKQLSESACCAGHEANERRR